ncbi:hypothetical protein CNYM01_07071 [Colletotrichum nymphaeae SA-01]|uniref:Cytochrome P450 n=1 Tax=Colletotrichum nymphaeae SA-01 TaxID=1460502 RepID=A0A135T9X2_9PEZI|nr:hypothetical protein CNYM01_07071 [Colletotrichum nymphaeae SA-01]
MYAVELSRHGFNPAFTLSSTREFNYPTATYHESFGTPPHPATSLVFPQALIPQEPYVISFVHTTNFQTKHLQAKIVMSLLVLFGSLALLAIGWLLSHILACLSLPGAYGPALARWTDAWYIWKIWQSKYEAYDIEAHNNGSRKVVRIGPRMYSIDDPAMARVIYGIASPLPKSGWYDAWGDPRIPNHNLFSARDRAVHGLMRRKVASMYSMSTIKSYEPYVDSCVALLLKRFDEFAESGEAFDLQQWMQCYAFDVIGEITVSSVFGRRVGFLESGGQDIDGIMRGLEDANAFSTFSGVNAVLLPILLVLYGNPVRGIASFARKLQYESDDVDIKEKHGGETFLTKVQRLQKEDPEEYERFRVRTLTLTGNVAAGSDTTSISLTSAMYHLLTTNDVVKSMYQELDSQGFCSSLDEHITFDQAQQLPYLQMVIKEALRLHPAVGLPMWREVVGSGLDVDGTHLPPGTLVGINPWVAHRNAKVFGANAADFIPERWDPKHASSETLAAMEQYYLPFGAGARTCIGKHISSLEMLKLIPELVRRYDFECLSGELKTVNRWFVKPQKVLFSVRRRGLGS